MPMPDTREASACLDEIAVLRVASGHWPLSASLEQHIDQCDVCRRLVAEAIRLRGATEPEEGAEALALQPGDRVGRYVLLGRLGEGGAGVVFRAHDPELDRDVAVKLVRSASTGLLREARAMAQLTDRHVVPVFDVGTLGDAVYVVMQHVRGGTLELWMAGERHWTAVLDRYLEAGRGLQAAHAAGIVHGDFKPSNVLIGEDGRAMVADFGLAARAPTATLPESDNVSIAGGGTPIFMAPEVHRGDPSDARADQFAFCVALASALYGRPPFSGSSVNALHEAKRDEAFVRPNKALPRAIWPLLRRGLRADPAERHASMEGLLAALQRVRDRGRRIKRAALVLGVGGVGAAVGAGALTDASPTDCPDPPEVLAAAWNEDLQAEILANAASVEAPAVLEAVRSTARRLDVYANAWRDASVSACRAGSGPNDPQVACLDLRRRALQTLVEELRTGDRDTLSSSGEAAWALREISECNDDPSSAWTRTDTRRAWTVELDRIRVFKDLGRVAEAQTGAEGLLARVQADGDPWMEAEVHVELCRQWLARQRMQAAWESCESASAAGVRGSNLRAQAWAWTSLGALGTRVAGTDEKAAVYDQLAGAAVAQLGDPLSQAKLFSNRAQTLADRHRYAEARALAEKALAVDLETWGPNHPTTALRQISLAGILPSLDEEDRALTLVVEARKALGASVGDASWLLALTYQFEAQALASRSSGYKGANNPRREADLVRAEAAYEEGWRRLHALYGPDSPRTLIARAVLLTHGADGPPAPEKFAELSDILERLRDTEGVEARVLATLRFFEVARLMEAKRNEEALTKCLPLVEEMATQHGEDNSLVGAVHNTCGIILERFDRLPEALAHHEAALAGRLASGGPEHSATLYSVSRVAPLRLKLEKVDAELVALLERSIAAAQRTERPADFIEELRELLTACRQALE